MEKTLKKISLKTEGISCPGCATDAEIALGNTEGIAKATVDYTGEIIHIEYDPEKITTEQLIQGIKKMGFKTKLLR